MTKENIDYLVEKLADIIIHSKKIVVFTGAGISTESGIPDFRSPGGIWTKYDPDIFTYQRFLNDPEARKMHWKLLGGDEFMPSDVRPNPAHYAIADLDEMGKLDCVITQNVDGLHEWALEEKAGISSEKVIHLHGTMQRAKCLGCQKLFTMDEIRKWIAAGTEVPDCPGCGGLLKPDAVFFGEAMPVWETSEAQRRSQGCDLCIVIGSSLVVYPAASMPWYAVQSGAKLAIINRDSTELDRSADVCIHEAAGETMSRVIGVVKEKQNKA
ncbi:MAG: Sir2 family NAD-dependent protein deacetylase [Thermodesulfobacteriota bacterium]|nr:Sir2 family NAD-dependent protein deacetylase [Thermodesulfobacteriota bacterium]